jgi:hypothetical protein
MGSNTVKETGVTITATEMIAGGKSRHVATVKIFENASEVMYTQYEIAYVNKFHARNTQINELVKYVQ